MARQNETVSEPSDTRTKAIKRTVCLEGLTPILFDRYPGDNDTKLSWWQKVYLRPETGIVSMPTTNIASFLSSHNTNSAPKRLRDKRKFKDICNACLSFVMVGTATAEEGEYIAFQREGKPIHMGDVVGDSDPMSGLRLHRAVARLDKGIPNPKERALLPLPWSLVFTLTILPNQEIKEQEIRNLFAEGGLAIGLGTFRGVFGKFVISRWD